jgi:solute carrier family 30 (zinc transporter), member 9
MAHSNQSKPIIVAILANATIAIAKAIGFLFSGSSALLSETIHSIADVMNQSLLLIGIKRGEKGASDIYHYGHSQERFFWNLVSAMGIFVLGCGVTVYHGVHDLLSSEPHKAAGFEQVIIEIILVISMLVEGYSFYVVIGEIKRQAQSRTKNFFTYLNESIDPSISAVFWEDFAAIIGLMLALIGIVMTELTGNNTFDAVASILIGLLMGWIAIHLAIENKRFLLDRAIPEYELKQLLEILDNNPHIKSYKDVRTVVLGPNRLKFKAELELDTEKIFEESVKQAAKKVRSTLKHVKSDEELEGVFFNLGHTLYANKLAELEKIKKQLKEKLPNLQHVNLVIS